MTAHSDDIDPAPAEFSTFYRDTVERAFRVAYLVARGDRRIAREATQHAYERLLRRWEHRDLLTRDDTLRQVTGLAVRAVVDRCPQLDDRGAPESARDVLACQPTLRRAVAILFFLEEYSPQEIACVLDEAESKILSDLERIRVILSPIVETGVPGRPRGCGKQPQVPEGAGEAGNS